MKTAFQSAASTARPPRKEAIELLGHVLQDLAPAARDVLQEELTAWLGDRKLFQGLLAANKDKVRKKLRTAADDGALLDVRAELLVAYLLSADRRFAVRVEAAGRGSRGPDFAVTYRERQAFNVEVTRRRPGAAGAESARLPAVLAAKLRQLATGRPNVVAVVGSGEVDAAGAGRALMIAADRGDATLLARGGFASTRELHGYYLRLSAVALVGGPAAAGLWMNPEARHPLDRALALALSRAFMLEPK